MQKGLVSIIVSVYNAERFLDRCIRSCLCQTYSHIELILINDGSTDGSGDICLGYHNADSRVVYMSKRNSGVAGARNAGLSLCKGEFVCFVDADDYIEPDYVERFRTLMLSYDADCAACLDVFENEAGVPIAPVVNSGRVRVIEKEELTLRDSVFLAVVHTKMYRARALCRDGKWLCFDTGLPLAQDSYFAARAVPQLRRMVKIDRAMYHYVQHERSATHTRELARRYSEVEAWEKIRLFAETLGEEQERQARFEKTVRCFRVHRDTIPSSDEEMKLSLELTDTMRQNASLVLLDREYPLKLKAVFLLTVILPRLTMGMNANKGIR